MRCGLELGTPNWDLSITPTARACVTRAPVTAPQRKWAGVLP
jgi:hypothetical protein